VLSFDACLFSVYPRIGSARVMRTNHTLSSARYSKGKLRCKA